MWNPVPCSIYRGGSSKGIFFRESDLPRAARLRDEVLMRIVGSPDRDRLDGLGGVTPTTSKVILVEPSPEHGVDVDYVHGQVSLDEPVIDYTSNGGNMAYAVGLFALNRGWWHWEQDRQAVTINARNTGDRLTVRFPPAAGPKADGGFVGYAALELEFRDIGGGATRTLFPTGSVLERLEFDGRTYRATVIDAGNLTVQLDAAELGLSGTETQQSAIVTALPVIQGLYRLVRESLRVNSPALPKMMLIGRAASYVDRLGRLVEAADIAACARDVTWGRHLHTEFPVTGAVAFAASSRIPGTLAHSLAKSVECDEAIRIGHPSGVLEVDARVALSGDRWKASRVVVRGSAAALLDGHAWVAGELFQGDRGQSHAGSI
jgi:2-methylaconitate cis-trans-isomerase PrpF